MTGGEKLEIAREIVAMLVRNLQEETGEGSEYAPGHEEAQRLLEAFLRVQEYLDLILRPRDP
jgi:hypothetical protein